MPVRSSVLRTLLWIFAASLVIATVVRLGLGFDLFVRQPAIADTLDLPTRLQELVPFRTARWPFDAVATLAYVVAFGALALTAEPISLLAGTDRRAGVFKSALLMSGVLGVAGGLLYLGAAKVTINLAYCDCGFKTQETISQFWAINIVEGATNWLGYGAAAFGAIAVALSALLFRGRGLSEVWRWTGVAAAIMLVVGVVLNEIIDSLIGDLLTAMATGVLLPAWALILATRSNISDEPSIQNGG